jgi:hypothetical protein
VPKETREQVFIRCRAFSHSWKWEKPLGIDDEHPTIKKPFGMSFGMIGFPAVCMNCGQEKVKWISRSGESMTRREYPEGYQKSGDDALSPAEYRHEYVESIFAQFEAAIDRAPRRRAAS